MIKLKFQISKYYLAYLLVNQSEQLMSTPLAPKVKTLQKQLDKKYENNPAYYCLNLSNFHSIQWAAENIYSQPNTTNFKKELHSISDTILKIYQTIFNSQLFKQILKDTVTYQNFVQKQWKQNEKFVLRYLQDIFGFKLPDLNITVLIVSPTLKHGHVISGTNIIIWGHPEDWKNYATVYLAHEICHLLFNYYHIQENDLTHAVIELITDNELRLRLNNQSQYFKTGNTLSVILTFKH